jgi:hypothetical protein
MPLKSFTYGVSIENIIILLTAFYYIQQNRGQALSHALYLKALNIMFRSNKR